MITDSCPCDHPNPTNKLFCCGDTTHFDLSWWAFDAIGDTAQGFMDVMYERLPSCPIASTLGVNRDTCDSYYGVISEQVLTRSGMYLFAALPHHMRHQRINVRIFPASLHETMCCCFCFQSILSCKLSHLAPRKPFDRKHVQPWQSFVATPRRRESFCYKTRWVGLRQNCKSSNCPISHLRSPSITSPLCS